MTEERDEYAGETGFKDDFDGVITEAWFERDAAKLGGNAFLTLKVSADDGDEVEQMYGCGDKWDSYDAGASVAHPDDKPDKFKKFHVNTKMQRLVNAAVGLDGVRDAWEETKKAEGNPPGTGARYANIWVGLKFHWELDVEEITIKDRTTNEDKKVTVTVALPTAFLGRADASGGGSTNVGTSLPSTSTPTSSAASTSGGPAAVLDSVPSALASQIVALSKAKTSHNAFVDAVMELPGVLDNNALMSALADEAWYNTIRAD